MNKAVDRIIITDDSQVKVMEWAIENKYLLPNRKINFKKWDRKIPLSEGAIDYETFDNGKKINTSTYFKVSDNIFKASREVTASGIQGRFISDFSFDFYKHELIDLTSHIFYEKTNTRNPKDESYESKEDAIESVIAAIILLIFVAEFRDIHEVVTESRITHINPNRKKDKNRNRKVVKIGVYRINSNFQAALEKRKFERHAEAWGVRGHWRTYKKSGKRVWVKEHEKGKGEKETKEYKIQ